MGKKIKLQKKNNVKLWNDCKLLIINRKLKTIKRLESQESTKNGWVHVDCFETNDGKLEVFKG